MTGNTFFLLLSPFTEQSRTWTVRNENLTANIIDIGYYPRGPSRFISVSRNPETPVDATLEPYHKSVAAVV
jgi:hypothetical protein